MNALLGLIVLFSLASSAVCLSCFSCSSPSNWTACEENVTKKFCDHPFDTCIKVHTTYTEGTDGRRKQIYEKDCFYKAFCHQSACLTISGAEECRLDCCDLEFCNAAAGLTLGWVTCWTGALALMLANSLV